MPGQRELEKQFRDFQDKLSAKKQAEEMSKKKAEEKKVKRTEFLLDLLKALIVAAFTLIVEHFVAH